MDPLSEILNLLKPRRLKTGATDVGGDMSVRLPAHDGLFCYAVLAGSCWIRLEEDPDAVRLETGDCVILASGRSFCISSDLRLPPIEAETLFAARVNGQTVTYGGGGDCLIYSGHFDFGSGDASVLLSVLPPIVHIRGEDDRATMRWALDRMMTELREPRPGSDFLVDNLAHVILVQGLRLHLADAGTAQAGWLSALNDPQMGAVISAVHKAPAERWSVQGMAAVAGMSRTVFALRFKASVGMGPMEYLTRWRMLLAASAMTRPRETVSSAAYAVGYVSESAFSTAFKRVMGCSPRTYRSSYARLPDASLAT